MSAWLRVKRESDGGLVPPAGVGPDMVCFIEGTSHNVSWGRCYPVENADLTAAHEWALTAQAVAAAIDGNTATVVGEGALAALIRLASSLNSTHPNTPPGVVVEATGTAAGITAALRSVRTKGSVVLAVRPLSTTTLLRTYHDVHQPGVRLIPVPWARNDARSAPNNLVAWALEHLASIEPGQPMPTAPWHRLAIGEHARAP